jgi:hypothetical protein
MMRDIYAAAKCVLVWLGNENLTQTDESVLFQYLRTAGDESSCLNGEGGTLFGQVLQSPWFERSWIVQEVCFARKVFFLCGSVGVSLPYLEKFLDMAKENYSSLPDSYSIPSDWGPVGLPVFQQFQKLRSHRELIQKNGGQPRATLTDILLDFQSSKATDARDKVFAFLGLAAYHNTKPEPVDYADSIGNAFVKAMMACSPSLYDYRILGYAGLANPRLNEQTMVGLVPTWVPDFSRTFLAAPFTILRKDFKATLPKDLSEAALESWSGNPQLVRRNPQTLGLFIKTAFIDTIEEMSVSGLCTVDSPFSNHHEILKRQREIAREGIQMLKRRKLYPDSNGASVICLETMSTGGFHNDNSISKLKTVAFEAFLESRDVPEFLPHQESGEVKQLFARIHESGIGLSRRLFTTEGGYLGVANNGIRKGDRVCLIYGAPVPFILRGPVPSHGEYTIYNLVCDAYVHGVMYGETFNICGSRFETILLE